MRSELLRARQEALREELTAAREQQRVLARAQQSPVPSPAERCREKIAFRRITWHLKREERWEREERHGALFDSLFLAGD